MSIAELTVGQPIWVASEGKVVDLVVTWVGARKAKAGPPHGDQKPVETHSVFFNGALCAVKNPSALSVGWSCRPVFIRRVEAEPQAAKQALIAAKMRAESTKMRADRLRADLPHRLEQIERQRTEAVQALDDAEASEARAQNALRAAEAEVARLEARKAADAQGEDESWVAFLRRTDQL